MKSIRDSASRRTGVRVFTDAERGARSNKCHLADEGSLIQELEDLLAPVVGELRDLHPSLRG